MSRVSGWLGGVSLIKVSCRLAGARQKETGERATPVVTRDCKPRRTPHRCRSHQHRNISRASGSAIALSYAATNAAEDVPVIAPCADNVLVAAASACWGFDVEVGTMRIRYTSP